MSRPNPPLIEAKAICTQFGGKQVLDKINLSIGAGEIVTLIGPNGAGKSSLVRILVGVIKPDSGVVSRAKDLRLGYVPQKLQTTATMPMSVGRLLSFKKSDQDPMQFPGIAELYDRQLGALSGGELKRVLLAHAMLDRPNLLILDEPTAGLDQPALLSFYKMIADLRDRENLAVLLVSHDLNVVMRASDRVICLNHHICCQGTPEAVSVAPEYNALLGNGEAMAIYAHHHDHSHDH